MSNYPAPARSFRKITRTDLRILATIAELDRAERFATHPRWRDLYEGSVVAVAVCQGAAAHFVGREDEYLAFYKFLSKFTHPSSWLVNSTMIRSSLVDYRQLIVGLAQVLAGRIKQLLLTAFDMKAEDIQSSLRSSEWGAPSAGSGAQEA